MATGANRTRRRPTPTQVRAARRSRRNARRRIIRYGGGTAIGLIAFIFILSLFIPGLPFLSRDGIGRSAPEGPGEKVLEQPATHIGIGEAHPAYNSVPAASGWHYAEPLAPVRWGIHDAFVEEEYRLHNMEHGGIGVHYDCPDGCPELVSQLSDVVRLARDEDLKVIMSPYPGMETKIALTAWTFIDRLDAFDEDRIKEFIRSHESSPNSPEPNAY